MAAVTATPASEHSHLRKRWRTLQLPLCPPIRPSSPSLFSVPAEQPSTPVANHTWSPLPMPAAAMRGAWPPESPPLMHLQPWASWPASEQGLFLATELTLWPSFCSNDLGYTSGRSEVSQAAHGQGFAFSASLVTATNWFPSQPIYTSPAREGERCPGGQSQV